MSLTSNTFANINSIEFGKFVELTNDPRFPAMSANRTYYRDNGTPLTGVDVYKKYAVLTYNVNEGAATTSNWDISLLTVFASAYYPYPNTPANGATIYNNSGTTINIKRTGGTNGIPLSTGNSIVIPISGNLNEISINCNTSSNASVGCLYTY